jgi:AmmeMemoRadiSam system protein A
MQPLTLETQQEMLRLAYQSLHNHFTKKPFPPCHSADPLFQEKRGLFVTLTLQGRLRGCIGTFHAKKPLAHTLCEYSIAALQDSRFKHLPLTLKDLPQLDIAISLLSPLQSIQKIEEICIGKHGIHLTSAGRSACFLPEVAIEQRWNAQEFVENCLTHKAGLPATLWNDPHTHLEIFETFKFHQKALEKI